RFIPGPLQFSRELDALGFAAGKFGCRLPEANIAETDLADDAERTLQRCIIGEELESGIDRHGQNIGNGLVADLYFKCFGIVAGALAGRARRIDAGQEQQLDADKTFALAGLATALGDVERETSGIIAPRL